MTVIRLLFEKEFFFFGILCNMFVDSVVSNHFGVLQGPQQSAVIPNIILFNGHSSIPYYTQVL